MMRPDPIFQGQRRHLGSARGQRQRRFRRLLLEPLEARHLLAILTPGVFTDGLSGGTLREAVIAANASTDAVDTLQLAAGTYTLTLSGANEDQSASGDLDIRKINGVIEIVGAGAGATTIDATGLGDRLFQVFDGAAVTFRDVTIRGGQASDVGGGIRNDQGTVILDRIILEQNVTTTSDNHGGGIHSSGTRSSLTIVDSTIRNNIAYGNGGGIYVNEGSLVIGGTTVVAGNRISQDDRNGAGLFSNGRTNAVLTGNLTFNDNTTRGHGGGFYNTQHGVIDGSGLTSITITNNQAGNDGLGNTRTDRHGGGFYNAEHGQVLLANATITDNGSPTVGQHGGGFYNQQNGEVTIVGGMIRNNRARDVGGGFYNTDRGIVTLTDVVLDNNTAGTEAGGFRNNAAPARVVMSGGSLANNQAGTNGGAFMNLGQVTLSGLDIAHNSSGNQGGGFYQVGLLASVTATDVNLTDNTAANAGGGFINYYGAVTLAVSAHAHVEVSRNRLINDGQTGGGFRNVGTGVVLIENGLIQDNISTGSGAGFHNADEGRVTITDGEISGNVMNTTLTDQDGGGFYNAQAGQVTLDGVAVRNNAARRTGGGFHNNDGAGVVTILDGILENNTAETSSGGGFFNRGVVNLTRTDIVGNRTLGTGTDNRVGGGFRNERGTGRVTIIDGDIRNNTAYGEGAGFSNDDGTVTIQATSGSVEISGNTIASPDHDGAGFRASGQGTVNLTNVDIKNNVTAGHGGGFSARNDAIVNLDGGMISGNQATRDDRSGGAFYTTEDARIAIANATIANNTAGDEGGGFYAGSTRNVVTIRDTTISGNTTRRGHGGGFSNRGTVELTRVDIVNNRTLGEDGNDQNNNGGGFYSVGALSVVTGEDVKIDHNRAHGAGAGFHMDDGIVTLTGTSPGAVSISGNQIDVPVDNNDDRRGGGFQAGRDSHTGQVTLSNAKIENNTTPRHGGGFAVIRTTRVTLQNVTLSGNKAGLDGGGFYAENTDSIVTIIDSEIRDNVAAFGLPSGSNRYGGGFRAQGIVNVSGSIIEGNRTELSSPGANDERRGGGLYLDGNAMLTISDSVVRNNQAAGPGGGIASYGTIAATNLDVKDNLVISDRRQGGGIWNAGAGLIDWTGGEISGNTTTEAGGGLHNRDSGEVRLTGVTITGNFTKHLTQTNSPGAGIHQDGTGTLLVLQDADITNNVAQGQGAGIYNSNGRITATETVISNNVAAEDNEGGIQLDNRHGGGIYNANFGFIEGTNLTIDNNVARRGGGFDNRNSGKIVLHGGSISGNIIRDNQTNDQGGGFYNDNEGVVILNGVSVTGNQSSDQGGGFFNNSSGRVEITNSHIDGNTAATLGGGFSNNSTNCLVIITDSTVNNNTAISNVGGGIRNNAGTVLATRVDISGNRTLGSGDVNRDGGGVFNGGGGKMTLDRVTLTNNQSYGRGAGMFTNSSGQVDIIDSTIQDNRVVFNHTENFWRGAGGGLVVDQAAAVVNISGSLIAGNIAVDGGGGIRNWHGTLNITNSTISGNRAGILPDDTFRDADGGGLQSVSSDSISNLNHVTVAGNRSTGNNAGGLELSSGVMTLENSIVFGNLRQIDTGATPADTRNTINLAGHNIIGVHLGTALSGSGTSDATDPQLAALADNGGTTWTHAIPAGSSAADASSDSTRPTDQRGVARPQNGIADLGAYEIVSAGPVITTLLVPAAGETGTAVNLNAEASGAGPFAYTWTITQPDGATFTMAGPTVSYTPTAGGKFQARVVATDNNGNSATDMAATEVTKVATVTLTSDGLSGGTLREAIIAANTSTAAVDIVRLAIGTYTLSLAGSDSGTNPFSTTDWTGGDLDIAKQNGVIVIAGGSPDASQTVIDAAGVHRVFQILPNSKVVFRNLTLAGGLVTDTTEAGGGFRNDDGIVTLENVIIRDNVVGLANQDRRGGGFFSRGHRAVVTLVDSQVINNAANGRGGGFGNESGSIVTLNNTLIGGNTTATTDQADRRGGGFWNSGHGMVNLLGDVEIAGNRSVGSGNAGGAGFFNEGFGVIDGSGADSVRITGNYFSGRSASVNHEGDGGGFWNTQKGSVRLNNAVIDSNGFFDANADGRYNPADGDSDNFGRSGGGFRNSDFGQVVITGGSIQDNWARSDGGGFYTSDHGSVTLTDVKIEGNQGLQGGGFYHVARHGTVTLTATSPGAATLTNNTARTSSGGAFSTRGAVVITGVDITANATLGSGNDDRRGGGFFSSGQTASVSLTDVNVTNNTAYGPGAGFYAENGSLVTFSLQDNTQVAITGNRILSSSREGGGFRVGSRAAVDIRTGDTGHSFDMNGNTTTSSGGAFFNSGGSVTLSNGTISGYSLINSGNGGAFYNQNSGVVTLTNVIIENNTAADNGGGFYNENSTGVVTIIDGAIRNNRSNGENDVNDASSNNHGGGFYNRGSVLLTRTDVTGNQTLGAANNQHHGGGFYNENRFSSVTLVDSLLNGNSAYGHGGGFYSADGQVTIRSDALASVQIAGNTINASDREGGGFFATGMTLVTLENVDVENNTATSHGGGFSAQGDAVVAMTGGAITDNQSTRTDRDGGGFRLVGQAAVNLTDVSLQDNTAGRRGGGFRAESIDNRVTMTGGRISNNLARTDDGGGFFNRGSVTLTNVSVDNNLADGSGNDDHGGGGFYSEGYGANVSITGGVITQNLAYGVGGGFANINGTVTITGTDITKNTVLSTDRGGGGFWTQNSGRVTISDSEISENVSTNHGGGFHVGTSDNNIWNAGSVELTNVSIVDNVARLEGGGFASFSNHSSVIFLNTGEALNRISGNRTLESYGGGFSARGRLDMTGVLVDNNRSDADGPAGTNNDEKRGGGGYVEQSATIANLVDVSFTLNQGGQGAGLHIRDAQVTLTAADPAQRAEISGNTVVSTSREGGGLWVSGVGELIASRVDIADNSATSNGGGIIIMDRGRLTLSDAGVRGNQTAANGGGIRNQGNGLVWLEDVLISENTAAQQGGGFYNNDSTGAFVLSRVSITDNKAESNHAGGFRNSGQVTGQDVVILGNEAGSADRTNNNDNNRIGGGFYNNGSSAVVDLTRVQIVANQAHGRGGGFYSDGSSRVSLTDFVISANNTDQGNNEGQGRGGGFWNSGGASVTLSRGEIADNESFGHGGGFFQEGSGSSVDLTHVTISGNAAGKDQTDGSWVDGRVGGGFYATTGGARVTLTHVTITDNANTRNGADAGAGFRVDSAGNRVTLTDSIVYGNFRNMDATPIPDDIDSRVGNGNLRLAGNNVLGVTTGDALGGETGGIIAADPLLGPLADNGGFSRTHALLPGSPAIDAAVWSTAVEDQRSFSRTFAGNAAADVGAFEVAPLVFDDTLGVDRFRLQLNAAADMIELRNDNDGSLLAQSPRAATTGVVLSGLDGGDTLTVDFAHGDPIPERDGLTFHGGEPAGTPGDRLIIANGSFNTVVKTFTGPDSGTIEVDGRVIAYTGLEPVDFSGDQIASLTINLPASATEAVIEDDGTPGDDVWQIRRTGGAWFETTSFPIPSDSLTINAQGGDTVVIDDFDYNGSTGPAVITFSGVGGGNSFRLGGSERLPDGAALILTGDASFDLVAHTETVGSLSDSVGGTRLDLGTGHLTVGGNENDTTFAATIVGSGSLTKVGGGILTLTNGASSYTGATVVNGGVLQLAHINATGTTSGVTVNNAGLLELAGIGTYNRPLSLNDGATLRGTGSSTYSASGNPVIASGATVTLATSAGSDQLNIGSGYTNASGSTVTPTINISGPGMVALNSSSSGFRGQWVVQAGTLRATMAGAFGSPAASLPLIGSTLTLDGGDLLVRASGDVVFNAGSGSAIPVTVSGATAAITSQQSSGTAFFATIFGSLTFSGSNSLTFTQDGSITSAGDLQYIFGGGLTADGNATINLPRIVGTVRPVLRLNGGISDGGSARTFTFDNSSLVAGSSVVVMGSSRTLSAESQIDLTGTQVMHYIAVSASANDHAKIRLANTEAGNGAIYEIRENSDATFDNKMIVDSSGRLQIGRVSPGAGVTHSLGSLTINNGSTLTVATGNNLTGNTPFGATFVNYTTLNGPGTLNVGNNGTGVGTLTLAGTVADGGSAGSLTKSGSGTLVLPTANTYTGTTTVSAGVLRITHGQALGTTAGGTVVADGAALQLDGNIAVGSELLTIGGQGISSTGALRNVSGNNSWAGNITTASGVQSRIHSDAGKLTVTGNITSPGVNTLVLSGEGAGEVSGAIGGVHQLTKLGSGTWALSGTNTYTTVTNVSAGTLIANSPNALGTAAVGSVVSSGATLDVRADVGNEAITSLAGSGVGGNGALITSTGTGRVGGAVTLTGDTTLGGGGSLALDGAIGGTHAMTKTGAGTVTLGGTSTYSGATAVNAGTLLVNGEIASNTTVTNPGILGGTGTINGTVGGAGTVAPGTSPGVLTINGDFTPTGTVAFEVHPPASSAGTNYDQLVVKGLLDLSGAALSFSGSAGAVAANQFATLIANDFSEVTEAATNYAQGSLVTINDNNYRIYYSGGDGNDVVLVEASTPTTVYVDDSFSGNVGQVIADADLGTTDNQLALFGVTAFTTINAGLAAVADGGTIVINGGTYGEAVSLTGTRAIRVTGLNAAQTVTINSLTTAIGQNVQIDGSSNLTIGDATSTTIAGQITGSGSVTKQGAGRGTLSANNSYAGVTNVNAGQLQITQSSALGTTAGGTVVADTARLELANNITVTGELLTITGQGGNNVGALQTVAGDNTWDGNLILGNSDTRIGAMADTLTVTGVIDDGVATLPLNVRNGTTGTTILTGASTYGGATNVIVGVLKLAGGDNRLPTASTLNVGNGANVGSATFDLNGQNQTLGGLVSVGTTMPKSITNSGTADSTVTVNLSSGEQTYAGVLSDGPTNSLSLTKSGTGTQRLGGANTYQGATAVSGGILVADSDTALGGTTGATSVSNGASLQLAGEVTVTGETVTIHGAGAASLGALQAASSVSATWAGTIVIGSDFARLGAQSNGTLLVSGAIIDGPGGVSANDLDISAAGANGKVVFSAPAGTNAYSGVTAIVRGTLELGADNTLPTTTILDVDKISGVTDVATVDLKGFHQQIAGLRDTATTNVNGIVTNSSGTSATFIIGATDAFQFDGQITGNLALVKAGSGRQTLAGGATNSYTGSTTVNDGTLALAKASGGSVVAVPGHLFIGDGSGVANSAVVELGGSGGNQIANSSDVTIHGDGRLDLNGLSEVIDGLHGTGSIDSGVSGTATLTVGQNNDPSPTFSGSISDGAGTVALTKVGSGTQTLAGGGKRRGFLAFPGCRGHRGGHAEYVPASVSVRGLRP